MKVKIINALSNLGYFNSICHSFPDYLYHAGLPEMLKRLKIEFSNNMSVSQEKVTEGEYSEKNCKYVKQISQFNKKLASLVEQSISSKNDFPLIIGGDHSISIGSVAGVLRKRKNLGVLWLDAHSDIHVPETTMTGWIYGMPAAVICGFGHKLLTSINKHSSLKVKPKNLCIFAAQFIDPGEYKNIKKFKVKLISMDSIVENGLAKSLDQAINIVSRQTDYIHLSLDLDVIDEQFAPGTTECSKGQLSYREIKYICKKLGEKKLISSMDVVEGEPSKDKNGKTAKLTLELIANILGKSYSNYDVYLGENKI